jgi:hypothetical protein
MSDLKARTKAFARSVFRLSRNLPRTDEVLVLFVMVASKKTARTNPD